MAIVEEGLDYARWALKSRDTCKWVKLACKRHFKDINRAKRKAFPYKFDVKRAQIVLDLFGLCRHYKGPKAGQPFELDPWETFIVASIFGWVHKETGYRRFRTAYVEVARKNGKSHLVAPIGLYMMILDGEAGAEVYSAATKRDQAKIVFETAKRMVKASPYLRKHVGIFTNNLHIDQTASKFEPLGADADTLDGLNSHCNIIDELHAHKTRELWDVLETGTGGRSQSLQIAITTAGLQTEDSICKEQNEYVKNILEGIFQDESYFGIIYTLDGYDGRDKKDKPDDWEDEACWIKANPALGTAKSIDDMRRLAEKAKQIPASQNNFLCKHLNIWTQQEIRWLDMGQWQKSGKPFTIEDLEGKPCFGGLDLATKIDLCAWVMVFPPFEDRKDWIVLPRFWVPEENAEKRSKRDRVPYRVWAKEGFIELTEGNVADYRTIRHRIKEDSERFALQEAGYDPWNATETAIKLIDDGVPMVEVRQGYKSLSEPSKHLEALVMSGLLSHGNHPVLRWCANNVTVRTDGNENIMPDKKKSTERIDGIVALVIALSRALVHQDDGESIYEQRGLIIL